MNYLTERTTSTHPISIGTSIALESIVKGTNDPYDDAVIKPNDVSKYQAFSINTYTLCRNILSACKSTHVPDLTQDDLRAALMAEISYMSLALKGMFSMVEFYYCEYQGLHKKYPHARLLEDKTDKQKLITDLIVGAVSKHLQSQKGLPDSDSEKITVYNHNYEKPQGKNTLMFTSQPYNLLAFSKSDQVCLIESHTAHLKSRPLWYTKLHMCKQEPWMPFNHVSLQLFGDNALFAPYPKEHRNYLIEVGRKFQWDSHTTLDRMKLNVSFDRENPIRHSILDLF